MSTTPGTVYDAVLCVGPHHREISLIAIRSLLRFTTARRVLVMTSRDHFPFVQGSLEAHLPVHLLDEDEVIEGITLPAIQKYLTTRSKPPARAGWYFQQFLKMSISRRPDLADHYLIWDSDTVALRALRFFDSDGRTLVNPKTEHLQPYFQLIRALLGIERQVNFSFISEHLMVNRTYMLELIGELSGDSPEGRLWPWRILDAIDDQHLAGSGFSEYETYGNFIAARHPDSFRCRPLQSTRNATVHFGAVPDRYAIHYLMSAGHAFATFEITAPQIKWLIALNRMLARALDACSSIVSRGREQRDAATELCGS